MIATPSPMHRLLTALALLLAAAASHAAAPMYTMELLLFEHTPAASAEQWPENPGDPDLSAAIELGGKAASAARFTPRPLEALTNAAGALKRSGGYRVLAHLAWRQPSYGPAQTLPVHITGGEPLPADWFPPPPAEGVEYIPLATESLAEPPRRLEGTARVHVGKYLHVELDLLYRRARPAQPTGNAPEMSGDAYAAYAEALPAGQTIRIRERRRMRSKELHYIDHPLVGALIIAHPYDPEEPGPPAD